MPLTDYTKNYTQLPGISPALAALFMGASQPNPATRRPVGFTPLLAPLDDPQGMEKNRGRQRSDCLTGQCGQPAGQCNGNPEHTDMISPVIPSRIALWSDLQRIHEEAITQSVDDMDVKQIVRYCRSVRLTLAVAGELDRFLQGIDKMERDRIQQKKAFYSVDVKLRGNDE